MFRRAGAPTERGDYNCFLGASIYELARSVRVKIRPTPANGALALQLIVDALQRGGYIARRCVNVL